MVTLVDEAYRHAAGVGTGMGLFPTEERMGDRKADQPGCHTDCAFPASTVTSHRG